MSARQTWPLAVLTLVLAACTASTSGTPSPSPTRAPTGTTSATVPPPARPRPGAAGAGDPYFPRQGNGGFDVEHYRLAISYIPSGHRLAGNTSIRARATQPLSRFDLDLVRTLRVSSVRIDGVRARAVHTSAELVITPATPIPDGARFEVGVTYSGIATPLLASGLETGWIPTDDGAFVAGEPDGSPTWFPVNDTPTDKASYEISITVPNGLDAISNGTLLGRETTGKRTTWRWRLRQPVQSYLITATVGRFRISTGRTSSGLPYLVAVAPSQAAASKEVLATLPAIVAYFSSVYGRYPFDTTGAIVDDARVGYALETATRPLFDRAPNEFTLAHELAHQWYGDDVTLQRWRDIWLNEGFAQFSSWLWSERRGGPTAAAFLTQLLAQRPDSGVWNPPPGDPGRAQDVFAGSVYNRGAGALQALREKLGGRTFFAVMRGWVAAHAYGNATVDQFVAYAERVSDRNLRHFFDVWLYRAGKPAQRVP